MILETFKVSVNESTENDIRTHLLSCNSQFSPPLSDRVDISEYSRKIREKASTFEAWGYNALVGLVAAYMDIPNRRCFITNVSVLSNFTGKGVAARLLNACLEHARAASIVTISLEVSQSSHPAICLYRKFDFQVSENRGGLLIMQYQQP